MNPELLALNGQIRQLQQALTQAQEMIAVLTARHLPENLQREMYETVIKHLNQIGIQKADQYAGAIHTTLLGLNELAQRTTDPDAKQNLVEIIKALNITIGKP
jgi:RNA processing factor Prp31